MGSKVKRSTLEVRVASVLEPQGFTYETSKVAYSVPAIYTPDFSHNRLQVEVKGWFRAGDRRKYMYINEAIVARGETFVFLFQKATKPVAKGTKLTLAGWCNKHGIPWFEDPLKLVYWAKQEGLL